MRCILLSAVLILTAPTFAAAPAGSKDAALAQAIAGSHRSPELSARDGVRHPQEVLQFFGIKHDMTVVEISPGGGYWTEILGPYLKDRGVYYTAVAARAMSERAAAAADAWQKKMDANRAGFGQVTVTEFGPASFDVAPAGSADLLLTFRNIHNWMAQGYAEQALAAFFKALKPGGILGVEEHRAGTDRPQDPKAESGYVREDYMKALAAKAGFKYLGSSEINANPKDTRDWPKGVWTLPPTLILGDQDRAKYLAIGEGDNFVMKFQKPLQ